MTGVIILIVMISLPWTVFNARQFAECKNAASGAQFILSMLMLFSSSYLSYQAFKYADLGMRVPYSADSEVRVGSTSDIFSAK